MVDNNTVKECRIESGKSNNMRNHITFCIDQCGNDSANLGQIGIWGKGCQELQASLKVRLWQRPSANLGPKTKKCGIKSGQTNHMKNHTILWTHLDWTMFNQRSMLLWMHRAMNESQFSAFRLHIWPSAPHPFVYTVNTRGDSAKIKYCL